MQGGAVNMRSVKTLFGLYVNTRLALVWPRLRQGGGAGRQGLAWQRTAHKGADAGGKVLPALMWLHLWRTPALSPIALPADSLEVPRPRVDDALVMEVGHIAPPPPHSSRLAPFL